ncbi:DUF6868 family protein [Dasania marina]|uniref:DUF6868 family protein n=1 Tax=Dasania marina TaxID=471499 RepID=UPI00047643C9|nr:hypothetical protein [Dasania marina]
MSIEQASQLLLYSCLLNYSVLFIWFLVICCGKDLLRRIHSCWFTLSEKRFDEIHYQLMGMYKLLIFVFNLSPYIVLKMVY